MGGNIVFDFIYYGICVYEICLYFSIITFLLRLVGDKSLN